MLVGQRTAGFSLSVTVTVKVQTSHVAVTVGCRVGDNGGANGKVLPLGGTLATLTEPQLSVAPTTKVTLLLLHWPASADRTSVGRAR